MNDSHNGVNIAHGIAISVKGVPTSATLVRKSAGAVDRIEGLAQVVGERVGGGNGVRVGLDLDGAVAAGCPDKFAN